MSKESVVAFIRRMAEDETFADRIIKCKNKDERMKVVTAESFDFAPEEIVEMTRNGEIAIDQTLAHIARASEGQDIRIFVRPGISLFE